MQHTRVHDNAIEPLMRLSPIAMKLIFFMMERMDDQNLVTLTMREKAEFFLLMKKYGKRVSEQSIHNAIGELKKAGMMNDYMRCSYSVNSNLFSKVQGTALDVPMNAVA